MADVSGEGVTFYKRVVYVRDGKLQICDAANLEVVSIPGNVLHEVSLERCSVTPGLEVTSQGLYSISLQPKEHNKIYLQVCS